MLVSGACKTEHGTGIEWGGGHNVEIVLTLQLLNWSYPMKTLFLRPRLARSSLLYQPNNVLLKLTSYLFKTSKLQQNA